MLMYSSYGKEEKLLLVSAQCYNLSASISMRKPEYSSPWTSPGGLTVVMVHVVSATKRIQATLPAIRKGNTRRRKKRKRRDKEQTVSQGRGHISPTDISLSAFFGGPFISKETYLGGRGPCSSS